MNLKSQLIAGRLRLPVNPELREGLASTQAFYGRNNSLSIAHERSALAGHGDLADAVATAVWAASKGEQDGLVRVGAPFAGVGIFGSGDAFDLHRSGLVVERHGTKTREFHVDPEMLDRVLTKYPPGEREEALRLLVNRARFENYPARGRG